MNNTKNVVEGYVLEDITLNVRKEPSAESEIVGKLEGGTLITIAGSSIGNEYLKIINGYVLAKYVSIVE